MRKMALCLTVVMVFAGLVAIAGDHGKMKGKTHDVTAEIVSIDAENGTVTFRTADGEKTAPVMKEAKANLDKVKAGDKVVLTCMDTEDGAHEAVVKIKPADKKA